MSRTRLCVAGHVATAGQLIAMGASRRRLSAAVKAGRLLRLRQGVYACPHVPADVAAAARIGGALTCVTVLRAAGVWAGESRKLHLQVPPNSSERTAPNVHVHWGVPQFAMTTNWEAGRMQALWQAIRCLDDEHALAALESAIHKRFLTRAQVAEICERAPLRLADGIGRMVNDSGSGLETIVRLRLQRAGHTVVTQAGVPGLGHQDLLVDDCLALETDGAEWHGADQFETDRERDLHAARLGRRTIRLTSRQVLESWPHSLTAIERAVDDARFVRNRGRN
jgi:very-short-patch-repair endonuclease